MFAALEDGGGKPGKGLFISHALLFRFSLKGLQYLCS